MTPQEAAETLREIIEASDDIDAEAAYAAIDTLVKTIEEYRERAEWNATSAAHWQETARRYGLKEADARAERDRLAEALRVLIAELDDFMPFVEGMDAQIEGEWGDGLPHDPAPDDPMVLAHAAIAIARTALEGRDSADQG